MMLRCPGQVGCVLMMPWCPGQVDCVLMVPRPGGLCANDATVPLPGGLCANDATVPHVTGPVLSDPCRAAQWSKQRRYTKSCLLYCTVSGLSVGRRASKVNMVLNVHRNHKVY